MGQVAVGQFAQSLGEGADGDGVFLGLAGLLLFAGAALLYPLIDASVRILTEMRTLKELDINR